jgi:hypothetical protein
MRKGGEGVGGTSQKYNGPKQSQQQLQVKWTHPGTSTAPLGEIIGPYEASGSSS